MRLKITLRVDLDLHNSFKSAFCPIFGTGFNFDIRRTLPKITRLSATRMLNCFNQVINISKLKK